MSYYKDGNGGLHEIDAAFSNLLPQGATEITEEEYQCLIAPSAKETALKEILELEASITQRRMREAALGLDNGWLAQVNEEIANLRKSL